MRVLSIDWDYFQVVSREQLMDYPDGIDLGRKLAELVWASHYVTCPALKDIPLAEQEFRYLCSLLLQQSEDVPVMVANSHKFAYDFILDNLPSGEKVRLTNVDMHQDIVNDNEELDCGNWIGHLIRDGYLEPVETGALQWVHNPVSFAAYGIDGYEGEFGKAMSVIDGGETIRPLLGTRYDLIFIALSATWSPPHLDGYFCELVGLCADHFTTVCIERGLDTPRQIHMLWSKKGENENEL